MIVLDMQDSRPLYYQVVEKFQNLILLGILEENDKMPSVRTMAMELSINPNTIQKAYAELERRGYIYTVKGRGNFVCNIKELRDKEKEKLLEGIKELVKAASEIDITREEIVEIIDTIMK